MAPTIWRRRRLRWWAWCEWGVLIPAMVWMGLPRPTVWQLMLFMGAIGLFGAGAQPAARPIKSSIRHRLDEVGSTWG